MKPGTSWRVLAHDKRGRTVELDSTKVPSVFDELVVDHWFHLEQMDTRHWWFAVYVGGPGSQERYAFEVRINRNGESVVTMIESPSVPEKGRGA